MASTKLQLWTVQPPLAELIRQVQPADTPPQRLLGAENGLKCVHVPSFPLHLAVVEVGMSGLTPSDPFGWRWLNCPDLITHKPPQHYILILAAGRGSDASSQMQTSDTFRNCPAATP
eukprot:359412-Chlamydomonas_euryale.AAC.8